MFQHGLFSKQRRIWQTRFCNDLQRPPIRIFIVVRADRSTQHADFAAALLDPALAVPMGMGRKVDKRYAVYRNNVTVGLVRAMEANFPAIRKLLGEVYFAGLGREFVQAHPPKNPLMFFYGAEFPQFLEQQSDLAQYPYLADVARLEHQWRSSYHELDALCLMPSEIAQVGDDQMANLRLNPHPALALLSSPFAVHSIFSANRETAGDAEVTPSKPECVMVTRPYFSVETREVSLGLFNFLKALSTNHTLGEAAELGLEVDPNLDLPNCIATCLVAGAFQPLDIQG